MPPLPPVPSSVQPPIAAQEPLNEPIEAMEVPIAAIEPLKTTGLLLLAVAVCLGADWAPAQAREQAEGAMSLITFQPLVAEASGPPLPSRLEPFVVVMLLVWLTIAAALAIRRWRPRRGAAAPTTAAVIAELALTGGCWLQLVRVGTRRLLVGHDRSGVRCLVELPPAPIAEPAEPPVLAAEPPEDPSPQADSPHAADSSASPRSPAVQLQQRTQALSPPPENPSPQVAAILDLFQQLRAATSSAACSSSQAAGELP
jgi:flagellar biogenesis protein FliO